MNAVKIHAEKSNANFNRIYNICIYKYFNFNSGSDK